LTADGWQDKKNKRTNKRTKEPKNKRTKEPKNKRTEEQNQRVIFAVAKITRWFFRWQTFYLQNIDNLMALSYNISSTYYFNKERTVKYEFLEMGNSSSDGSFSCRNLVFEHSRALALGQVLGFGGIHPVWHGSVIFLGLF